MKLLAFVKKLFSKTEEPKMQTPTLEEARESAERELEGAQQRLDSAHRAIQNFRSEHTAIINGKAAYVTTEPNMRSALDRQQHVLLTELDEARRVWAKCLADRNALLPARSCISAGLAPAKKVAQS